MPVYEYVVEVAASGKRLVYYDLESALDAARSHGCCAITEHNLVTRQTRLITAQ